MSNDDIQPAPPQPPFTDALRGVLSAANNLTVAASVAEHCRYPESSLRGDVEDLRDACVAYLAGLPEEQKR